MTRRLAVSLVSLAALAGGCSLPTTDQAVVVGPADLQGRPGRLPPLPADGPTDEHAVDGSDAVVLVGPDGDLVVERRPPRLDRPADAVRALDTLLATLSTDENGRGLSTSVPPTTALVDYRRRDDGHVEVALTPDFDAPGTEAELDRRLAQVACTVALSSPATLVDLVVERSTVAVFDVDDCPPGLIDEAGAGGSGGT